MSAYFYLYCIVWILGCKRYCLFCYHPTCLRFIKSPKNLLTISQSHRQFTMLNDMSSNYNQNLHTIYLYTRPGCKYCRIAKATLNNMNLPYMEIDINAENVETLLKQQQPLNYNLLLERLEYTRQRTVPQIYVADDHIGGCDDLLKQIEANKFVETLIKWNIQQSIPVIPSSSTTCSSPSVSAVESLISNKRVTISHAPLKYLNEIPNHSLSSSSSSAGDRLLSPLELSKHLQLSILQLSDQFISKDGKKVKYGEMATSALFQEYISQSQLLNHYSIESLAQSLSTNQQKLSFFVNIYNALIIHATCILGAPANNPTSRTMFFNGTSGAVYKIGSHLFSADDIEHGIIRANTAHPSQAARGLTHYFNAVTTTGTDDGTDGVTAKKLKITESESEYKDPRAVLSLSPPLDPRIHFLLNCGAASCPPIAVLGDEDPETALRLAAQTYLESELSIDVENKKLFLPKLLLWYGMDFGATIKERLRRVVDMLSETRRAETLSQLQALGWRGAHDRDVTQAEEDDSVLPFAVEYNDYNWASNDDNSIVNLGPVPPTSTLV